MRHKKRLLAGTILLGIAFIGVKAQEAIPATGGNHSGAGGTVSYTVGQVVYKSFIGNELTSVSEGVQQPYEISIKSGIEKAIDVNLVYSAYPNPTTDFLLLNVQSYNSSSLSYQLYNSTGKLLSKQKISSAETRIETDKLPAAVYVLKLVDNNKVVKIFQIIKN